MMQKDVNANENRDPLTHNEDTPTKPSEDDKMTSQQNMGASTVKSNKSSALTKSALTGAFKNSAPQTTTSTAEDQDEATVMVKYTAYWAYKKEEDKIYSVIVELPHLETVIETIRDVLPFLNQRLAADHAPFTLSEDPTLYDLYKAKKTGHPKLDYPALDSSQVLNQTGVQQISIVEKDQKAIISKATGNKNTSYAKEPPKMVNTIMPVEQSTTSIREVNEEFTVETSCWCIKTKKPIPKSNNNSVSLQNLQPENLNSSLLDDTRR